MVAIAPKVVTRLIHPLQRIYRGGTNLAIQRCPDIIKPAIDRYVNPAVEQLSDVLLRAHNVMSRSDYKLAGSYKQACMATSTILAFDDRVPSVPSTNTLGDFIACSTMGIYDLPSHLRHSRTLATQYVTSKVQSIVGAVLLFTLENIMSPVFSCAFELAKPYIDRNLPTRLEDLIEIHSLKYPPIIDIALSGNKNTESTAVADMSNDTTLNGLEDIKTHESVRKPNKQPGSQDIFSLELSPKDRSLRSSMHAVDLKNPKLGGDDSFFTNDRTLGSFVHTVDNGKHESSSSELDDSIFMKKSLIDRSLSASIHAVNTKNDEIFQSELGDILSMGSSAGDRSLSRSMHAVKESESPKLDLDDTLYEGSSVVDRSLSSSIHAVDNKKVEADSDGSIVGFCVAASSPSSLIHAVDVKKDEVLKSEPYDDFLKEPPVGDRSLSSSIHAVDTEEVKSGDEPLTRSSVGDRSLTSSIHAIDTKKGVLKRPNRFFNSPNKFRSRFSAVSSSSASRLPSSLTLPLSWPRPPKLQRSGGSFRSVKNSLLGN